jgi:hypothetical protein
MSDECPGLTTEQIETIDATVLAVLRELPSQSGVFLLCFQADGQPNGWNFGSSNCPFPRLLVYLESWIAAQKRKVI